MIITLSWLKNHLTTSLNLEKIIDSIKIRPTHQNIMRPGLGVGGYCLTKDPKFILYSSKKIMKNKINFPLIKKLNSINKNMVNTSIEFLKRILSLKQKKILIYGMTYKENVGDFRYSASEILAEKLLELGVKLEIYDPYIQFYENKKNFKIAKDLFSKNYDVILFCVKHSELNKLKKKFFNKKCKYIDLNSIFKNNEITKFKKNNYHFYKLGND